MSPEGIAALYGAVLATVLALAQLIGWWRRRVNLEVLTGISRNPISDGHRDSARGTPVRVSRDGDERWEEILIGLEIRNRGGTPVQIVGVLVEFRENGEVRSIEVAPEPLPSVVQPGTRIECSLQKEVIDLHSAITFFGVVDALGRRYTPKRAQRVEVIRASWQSPTRIGYYVRRDDLNGEPVVAFQMKDRARMSSSRPARRFYRAFIAKRGAVQ